MRLGITTALLSVLLLAAPALAEPPIFPPDQGGPPGQQGGPPPAPQGQQGPQAIFLGPQEVASILQQFNLPVESGTIPGSGQNPPVPAIKTSVRRFPVLIVFFGCKQQGCDSLQLSVTGRASQAVNLAFVNNYNSKYRFTKMYLDNNNNYHFEMDISTMGGVTLDNFVSQLKVFDFLLGEVSKG